ncbi:MAG TPA: SMP-30/gluconolactonase/LRE family protein [Fibrobacteria bacterium]|nr:SMP-30/gluconolactonase/LRE family protein [Fibrobacteria bacterium]
MILGPSSLTSYVPSQTVGLRPRAPRSILATAGVLLAGALFAPSHAQTPSTIQLPDSLFATGDTITWWKRIPTFCEGPAWDAATQSVFFTRQYGNGQANWPIYKIGPGQDTGDVHIETAAQANGLAFDAEGLLVAAQNGKLTRYKADGSVDAVLVTSGTNDVTFNQANDLSIGTDGAIYFTDLGNRVFHLNAAGELSVAYTGATSANGINWVEADSAVYVNESRQVKRYTVNPDGSLSDPQVFITVAEGSGGTYADGSTIDSHGNHYVANFQQGEIRVFNANGDSIGRVVPQLATGSYNALPGAMGNVSNLTFGGSDLKTLFFTGDGGLFSIRVKVPGVERFPTTSVHAGRLAPKAVFPGKAGPARDLRGRMLPASRETTGPALRLPATNSSPK